MASSSDKCHKGVEENNLVPHDEHALAALLKTFYRELPELLVPDTLFDDLTTAAQDGISLLISFRSRWARPHLICKGSESAMIRALHSLPTLHMINLQFLLSYLDKLVMHAEHNKMDLSNIALLFAPNIIASPASLLESHVTLHLIMKKLIEHNRAIRQIATRP